MLLSLVFSPVPEKAVTIDCSIQQKAKQADHFTVKVQLDIGDGWHLYDETEEGVEIPVSVKLKLPEGATTQGGWNRPLATEGAEPHQQIFEGQISFSRAIVVKPNAFGETIDVMVSYQACTKEYCNPPQKKTISITIPKATPASDSIFEPPVRLSVDGKPLNTVAKRRYPSPSMFDVDGDGNSELVVGSLMGYVGFYENQNESGKGDPVWGPWEALDGIDGEAVKTPNW